MGLEPDTVWNTRFYAAKCQQFPLAINWELGSKEEVAASKEEDPVSMSFLHRLLVLSWGRNPKKGHCYWGYETSGRQDEHKDAAVQSGI